MAHHIPYVATATVANLRDLEDKVTTRDGRSTARATSTSTCRARSAGARRPRTRIKVARWRSSRASSRCSRREHGEITGAHHDSRRKVPVDRIPQAAEALRAPLRQAAGHAHASRAIQAIADRNIAQFGCSTADAPWKSPSPSRSTRVEPRQQDRLVAHQPPGLRRPAAAVQSRLPGRRGHPGLALSRRSRRLRRGVAALVDEQSAARDHGARLLPPVRGRLQPRRSSTRRSASTRSSASSATRRCKRGWAIRDRCAERAASGCSSSARDRRGLSAAYHLRARGPRRHDRRGRPARRRHDALRHPEVPAAARRARCARCAHPRRSASTLEFNRKVANILRRR